MVEAATRVLVVEDDPTYRTKHRDLLREAGHFVETADDGQAGLERVMSFRPDVVLTDWVMPRMDGLTLCRLLKGNEELKSTFVIMLSTRDETHSKVTGLDVGADEYLVKPVEPVELLARVRSGLRLRRALVDLAAKNELLERLALTDPLTGLANRRAFDESLEAEICRSFRHCSPLSILYLDLDHFKRVNDRHGHAVGDEVLVAFADVVKRHARRGDLAARIGGEEFALLLPHAGKAQARTAAERIRRAVETASLGRSQTLKVTTSIGVAVFRGRAVEDRVGFLAEADGALYRAKSEGRNRVVLAEETFPGTDS